METNHVKVLKVLATKSPRTSRDIAETTGAWADKPPERGKIRVNSILRVEAGKGHVRRAGIRPARYHNTPAFLWEITPAGRKWLDSGTWERRGIISRERDRAWALSAAHRSALMEHLDREAQIHDWGPDTSAHDRKKAVTEMRELGCTLQSLADVFGITREYVRLIMRGWQSRGGGITVPIGVSGKVNRQGRWVRLEDKS